MSRCRLPAPEAAPPAAGGCSFWLAMLLALCLSLCGLQPAQAAAPQTLLLALRLNGVAQDRVVQVLQVASGLALERGDWAALNLKPVSDLALRFEERDYQTLSALPGLQARVDSASQTLLIDAPPSAFGGATRSLDPTAPAATQQTLPGGWLNYDLLWQRSGGVASRNHGQALLELGAFGGQGYTRLTGIARTGTTLKPWTRLDTTWTREDADTMQVLRVGDTMADGGAWGRAIRYGGLQWSTDFSLRPGFLSFPLPVLQGEVALPSTMDLYINHSRVAQSALPAGAFELKHVPVLTGQGELRMVVRDLLGREQEVVQPYYAAPTLLRPGLHARSASLGRVRLDYGLSSSRYGPVLASYRDRVGLDETRTVEWRVEQLGSQRAAGVAGLWLAPQLGLLNASAVLSDSSAGRGALFAAGLERQSRDLSGSLQLRYGTAGHRLSGSSAERTPRVEAFFSLAHNWAGSAVGLSALHQSTWQGERQRLLTLNTSRELGRSASLTLLAQRDVVGKRTMLALSLNVALDGRINAGLNLQHAGRSNAVTDTLPGTTTANGSATGSRVVDTSPSLSRSVDLQSNPLDDSGLGWQLSAEPGLNRRVTAQATWLGEHAQLNAGISRGNGSQDSRAGASGGVTLLGTSLYAGRRIDGSFALVDVGGYSDVRVLLDHRPVARTDAKGRALVSGLRGREAQRIGVEPADLPFDAEVVALDTVVTPPTRGGVAVTVPISRARAATFTVLDAAGLHLPPGTLLQVAGQNRGFPVGFEGKAFVSGLGPRSRVVRVGTEQQPEHSCSLWLDLPAYSEQLPDLGVQTCR